MVSIFLSYRPGDDGGYAESLLRELCDAVRLLGDAGSAMTAYLSTDDGNAADGWPAASAAALAECTVFVAVCSERYFLTERCGREWWTFEDRLEQHEATTGRRPKAIVPIAWGDNGLHWGLPDHRFATDIALHQDVRALARLRSNRTPYRNLIARLARHIVDVSRQDPVPPAVTLLPYRATPNAFRAASRRGERGSRPAGIRAPVSGVRFVIVAGRRDEMASIRQNLEFYGGRRIDWRPYRPEHHESIAGRAQSVAAEHLFYSEVVDDVEGIVDVLDRADTDLVVILVDAWVARIEIYQRALTAIDRRDGTNTAVVVPLSTDDAETTQARSLLGTAVSRLLALRTARRDPMLRIGPDSAEEFDDELGEILEAARNLTFRSGKVRRTAPGAWAGARPILDAP